MNAQLDAPAAAPQADDLMRRGMAALFRELGVAGTVQFFRRLGHGGGDSVEERRERYENQTDAEVMAEIREYDRTHPNRSRPAAANSREA